MTDRADPNHNPAGWTHSAPLRLAAALTLVVSIAALDLFADQLTGRELGFFVFYFLPITLAAWNSRRQGLFVGIVCAATWFAVEYVARYPIAHVWNTAVRLVAFGAIAIAVTRIKELLDQERHLNEALSESMRKVRVLRGLVPICGACKSIRNDEGYWERLEKYIESHSEAEFSHSLCPKCAEQFERTP